MKTYLELEEIVIMEEAASNLRDKILIHLLFRLGCRISEALSIKVDDVDFAQGTVTIIHLKRHLKLSCSICRASLASAHLFCPKCGEQVGKGRAEEQQHRRQRVLPVDTETLKMLTEYIERGGLVVRDGKLYLFGINRHRAWQIIRQCAQKAGLTNLRNPETGKIRRVSPHRLRDAFSVHAMKMDDSGEGMRLLQEHLGHASFNTTARYRKIASEEHKIWYEKLWQNKGEK